MKIRVVDIETSAISKDDGGIIEIGYCDIVAIRADLLGNPCEWEVTDGRGILVNPGHPIPPENSAVHHLIDEDLVGAGLWSDVAPIVFDPDFGDVDEKPTIAYAAHRAEFESDWIGEEHTRSVPWICTLKAAYRYWPDAPAHNNSALRYWRKPEGLDRSKADPAHRAFPDAYTTAFLLRDLLNDGVSVDELIKISSEPAITPKCYIGKWRNDGKGTPWAEIDSGFLRWMLEPDKSFKEDEKHTARYHLEQREMDQRIENERREIERQEQQTIIFDSITDEQPEGREFAPLEAYSGEYAR